MDEVKTERRVQLRRRATPEGDLMGSVPMKRYTYSDSFASAYKRSLRSQRAVPRERVSKTLSVLDVMLSIWIAEAILDDAAGLRAQPARPRARRARIPAPEPVSDDPASPAEG